ncbi:MAG: DUF5060 domain-containing protein [Lentisphaerae bacterium]|jgi:hypothetical protein|nr:DUF5060 domain-containing protein [Lentisphaerota bacterium]MBT4817358.1 DUF5060 domain-containing protein [Lentisphaerota bacterium]MBT5607308.1 DUF5060 domain-containing protein [Lentisphaerota bacterium]MBT7055374.1 DUF5060 domain-containing protein [Lentisphaerota bacterium]MBT7840972.1 DUF5060 domain-containing protein [Lentisphaerota bacterium]
MIYHSFSYQRKSKLMSEHEIFLCRRRYMASWRQTRLTLSRYCIALWIAAVLLICPCFVPLQFAQEANGDGHYAALPLGQSTLTIGSLGGLSLSCGERTLIASTRVVIATPGWRSTVSQSALELEDGYPKLSEGAYVFRGSLEDKTSGCVWTFEQRVEAKGKTAAVTCMVSPSIDTVVAEAALFIDLPVSSWAGQDVLLVPSNSGRFPKEQAKPRHFMSGGAIAAVLGAGGESPLTFDFTLPARCTLQDGREYGGETYQMYPRLATGGKIAAGTPCRLEFVLKPNDLNAPKVVGVELGATGSAGIGTIRASSPTVAQYAKFELDVDVSGTWENAFDPDQVALDAVFACPDGRTLTVPGFFYQDYTRTGMGDREMYLQQGEPGWKVRFAPPIPGLYRYRLRLRNQGGTVKSPEHTFTCTPDPDAHGYLRVSRGNSHYLQFDDGTPFFALGENIATLPTFGLAKGEQLYETFAGVGGNFVRWWWSYEMSDLESRVGSHPGEGPGRYKLMSAWCIDQLMEKADELGIYLMCCFETQQYLRRDKRWPVFTYNVANGGPVATPRDYFTNAAAASFFRKRLRYIVARWSYSTAVFSWQFWNEVSACNQFRPDAAAVWHREMGRYLRSIDPMRHVIHTNHGNFDGYPIIDEQPETEIISTNSYSRRDMGQTAAWGARFMSERYAKPFFLTEYGVGHHGGWEREDPDGIIVVNGLWGAAVNGSAGTAMPWGWSNWVDALGFYKYWLPIRDTVAGIPFCKRTWEPVAVRSFRFRDTARLPYHTNVLVEGWPRNYAYRISPESWDTIELDSDGELRKPGRLKAALGGGKAHQFSVTYPVAGEFVVHVPELAQAEGAILEASVDGKVILRKAFSAGEDRPYEFWQHVSFPVSAGGHDIVIRNAGQVAFWTAYELVRYRRREGPDLDVTGIQTHDTILLWVRNPQFAWLFIREGREPTLQPEGSLTLAGVAEGQWRATWRETTTNEILRDETVTCRDGALVLNTPAIARAAGVRIQRVR